MIAKAIKGRGFRGALDYDLNKEQGRVIDTNMSGSTPRELAREFGEIRKLRPKLGKAVLHVSLSAAPGEHLSDEQWKQIAGRYLVGMGLEKNQYLVTRHTDTEHEHIHLLVNRIRFDGSVTSDSHDYRRHEVLMRAIERDYSLQRVHSSKEVERHAPTKGEIEEGLRTGVPSTRQLLQQLCDSAVKDCASFSQYAERLQAVGVTLVPVTQLEGAKMSGLSYVLDGVMMKGSDLGKGYSPMGLSKRGVSYVKERDAAAVSRCLEHSADRGAEPAGRTAAAGEGEQRGGTGGDLGAAGPGLGRADGRDAREFGADQPAQQGTGRAVSGADRERGPGMERGGERSTGRGPADGQRGAQDGVAPLSAGRNDRDAGGAARQRILALAGTSADDSERARPQGDRGAVAARDRSAEAAQRQMMALGVDSFLITLIDTQHGIQEQRRLRKRELEKSIAWFKRMNARGYDVWMRPEGEHGLVLLAGLSPIDLQRLRERGFNPAAVVETGREQYQAWLKLSQQPLEDPVRRLAAQGLVRGLVREGANLIAREDGRLTGFTNQQVLWAGGRHPFVQVVESNGGVAPAAMHYLERLQHEMVKARDAQLEREAQGERERKHDRSRGLSR